MTYHERTSFVCRRGIGTTERADVAPAEAAHTKADMKTSGSKKVNHRSMEDLAQRFKKQKKMTQGYVDDFNRYCLCMHLFYKPADTARQGANPKTEWWIGSGGSTPIQGDNNFCVEFTPENGIPETRRCMPPFSQELLEKIFVPWMLKWWSRANLTAYEYAINDIFLRENTDKYQDKLPWAGKLLDEVNIEYTKMRSELDHEDGVEKNAGGANKLKEAGVQALMEKAVGLRQKIQECEAGNQQVLVRLKKDLSECMTALSGIIFMLRSNSLMGIDTKEDVTFEPDGGMTMQIKIWAAKSKKKKMKSTYRKISKRLPPGKTNEHPRNIYISLMKFTVMHAGGFDKVSKRRSRNFSYDKNCHD